MSKENEEKLNKYMGVKGIHINQNLEEELKMARIIPYGTKIIYHGTNGWENCKCYCGHYNAEDDTYNIYRGWDLCHIPSYKIEVYEWS